MSRVQVAEEQIGPIVAGGPCFLVKTYHEFLCEGDDEPLSVEHEIPDSVHTRLLRAALQEVGCWRREGDSCWRFNAKKSGPVMEVLQEALEGPAVTSADEVSEASSPVKRLTDTPQRSRESLKHPLPDSPRPLDDVAMDEDVCPEEIYLGWGAKMRTLGDDRVAVSGDALRGTEPLILNLLRFEPAHPVYPCLSSSPVKRRPGAGSPGAPARARAPAPAPRWVSAWPLTAEEREFVETVLRHRLPAAALGQDQLVAIPPEAQPVPLRFLPADAAGRPLAGPHVSHAAGGPQNCGRQFFGGAGGGQGGFLWADGTAPAGPASERPTWQGSGIDCLSFEEEGSGDWDGWSCGPAGDMELEKCRD